MLTISCDDILTGVIRALVERNHRVSVAVTSICGDTVKQFSPGISSLTQTSDLIPDLNFFGDFSDLHTFRTIFTRNATTLLYEELDELLTKSNTKFDVIFTDFCAPGSVLAAKKHNIPVVSQFMGPVVPQYSKAFYWDQNMLPQEDPDVSKTS